MTLSSLMSHIGPSVPNYNLPPVPDLDRTHWSGGGGGGGGWKGGKGQNPNAALSALTLLAFLFFLNILQSCLRDTIGQNNGMLVMVLPPNSTATNRAKREVDMDIGSREKEDSVTAHQKWNDFDITNLVHTQVESYWSNKGNKTRINPLNGLQTENKRVEINKNIWDPEAIVKNRISTKLILKVEKENDTSDTSKMTQRKPDIDDPENLIDTVSVANKENQLVNGFWTKTISLLINNAIPYVKKVICCSNIVCEKKENQLSTNGSRRDNLIRTTMSWFCNVRQAVCGYYASLPCQN